MILWTTSLPSKWPKVYSKISLHKVTILMFSQELIWKEICYTNIVVSGLILKMRSEDTILEKWCISLPFHSLTIAIKADHEAAENFVCHRGPPTKDSKKWLYLYADWLQSILYCYSGPFQTSCYRRAELNSQIANALDTFKSLLSRFFIFVFSFRQQPFYSTDLNSTSEIKSW